MGPCSVPSLATHRKIADIVASKSFQKILAKQGLKFKLNTKVISAAREGDRVSVKVDAAKGGKEETVSFLTRADQIRRS